MATPYMPHGADYELINIGKSTDGFFNEALAIELSSEHIFGTLPRILVSRLPSIAAARI